MEQFLQVGAITSTHGIRGEVKVFPTTDDPARFKKLKKVILDTGKRQIDMEIQSVRFFKQFVIVKFKGIDNINDVEQYKGSSLFVSRENAVSLEENEYYIADLIGMEVFTEEGHFGIVKDVMETGANEVYIIDSDVHGEVLVPAIKQCIENVDVENGKMQIRLLEGLIGEILMLGEAKRMNFHILTLFPEMVENGLKTSIIGRAVAGGLLSIEAVNIRDFAFNKHQSVDDYPYGGGAGMLMQAEPVYLAYKDIEERIQKRIQNAKMQNAETEEQDAEVKVQNAGIQDAETVSPDKKLRVVYLSPQGKTFDQKMAEELAEEEDLVLLCGHYEGIDERVLEEIVTDYVSIGDYVLTGGELPAMVMVDTISRLVPGVLHNDVSAEFESFQDNLLEYPQYSRPEEWHGKKVPPVLLSGHHANIEKWRREQSILRTYERRPDLLEKSSLTWKEKKWLEETVKEKTVHEEPEDVTECTN